MFNTTQVMLDAFVKRLRESYQRVYGSYKLQYAEIVEWAAGMAIENIACGDALYHNVEHTILVTLVGQEILRGRHLRGGGVSCEDWLNFSISLLCHDIGYVKGVCPNDSVEKNMFETGVEGKMIMLSPGSSGAGLTPYHVDRAKLFIESRFSDKNMLDKTERWNGKQIIDAEVIKRNIELTRFPVPADEDHTSTESFPGLLRAADLIGQLSDPHYMRKINALFFEFEEMGANQVLGYKNPDDLRRNYPRFYWSAVYPFIKTAADYLKVTQEGSDVIANLYANVFVVEHEQSV